MSAQMPAPSAPPLSLGIVLYPGFTLLDLAGPQSALGLHGETPPVLEDARSLDVG